MGFLGHNNPAWEVGDSVLHLRGIFIITWIQVQNIYIYKKLFNKIHVPCIQVQYVC